MRVLLKSILFIIRRLWTGLCYHNDDNGYQHQEVKSFGKTGKHSWSQLRSMCRSFRPKDMVFATCGKMTVFWSIPLYAIWFWKSVCWGSYLRISEAHCLSSSLVAKNVPPLLSSVPSNKMHFSFVSIKDSRRRLIHIFVQSTVQPPEYMSHVRHA